MPFKKLVDTAITSLFLFVFVVADTLLPAVFPLLLTWFGQQCVRFQRMSHVGLSQSLQSLSPLVIISQVREHVINFWPMRQKEKSRGGGVLKICISLIKERHIKISLFCLLTFCLALDTMVLQCDGRSWCSRLVAMK